MINISKHTFIFTVFTFKKLEVGQFSIALKGIYLIINKTKSGVIALGSNMSKRFDEKRKKQSLSHELNETYYTTFFFGSPSKANPAGRFDVRNKGVLLIKRSGKM